MLHPLMSLRSILLAITTFTLIPGWAAWAESKSTQWTLDPAHTAVVFKVNHLGFSNTFGMFRDISGSFQLNDTDPSKNQVEFTIKAASVETMNSKRDEHLRKPDFFNVKQHPLIVFKSQSVTPAGPDMYKVMGKLTLHGVTKDLSFDLKRFRTGPNMSKVMTTGGETTFTIKRSEFGMNYAQGPNGIGDEITITVSFEGNQKG